MPPAFGKFSIRGRLSIILPLLVGGFDANDAQLSAALARFPDADPSRPFDAEKCTLAIFESAGAHSKHLLDLDRAAV